MQNVLSSEKRTLGHWVTVQFFFSLAQVRCFWRCFCFRSGLLSLFLKMSERGDSWCTDSSFSSLLVKLSQVFESAFLDSILKLVVIPVACAHFLPNFFLPVNFVFNMLWYSTHWTATPFTNDPLWLTLFVEGVNDRKSDVIFFVFPFRIGNTYLLLTTINSNLFYLLMVSKVVVMFWYWVGVGM